MPRRIFLILAIIAGLAAILLSQLQLRPQIKQIISDRETNRDGWTNAIKLANKLSRDLNDTKSRLDETARALDQTRNELSGTRTKLQDEQKRAGQLQKDLDAAKTRASNAEAELAAWKALPYTVDQIKALAESEKKKTQIIEALEEENRVLIKRTNELERLFAKIFGEEGPPPPVPEHVRGRVLAVDPKFDFVVLDIGDSQGVKPRAILLVSRNSRLVAKVQVSSTQGNRSIANIMPGWKIGEVFEGDLVMP